MDAARTREYIVEHCARYPLLQCADLLKFLHHSVFGCGHLVDSPEAAADWLRREMADCTAGGEIKPLDGPFCRVHLSHLKALGVSPDSFARLFALSAQKGDGRLAELEARLEAALDLAREGLLPFSYDELSHAVADWRKAGFPARHHSDAFRSAYAPAYRVLHRSHAALLPLLGLLDRKLVSGPAILAIEGGAGSGKSTLASALEQIYGGTVLHMDDFFLRPEQRTPERYATPGGNIDHERFSAEVLPYLRQGEPFRYRPFDCATFTVTDGFDVTPGTLTIIEGSYSMHPALGRYYDCAVFLTVDPDEQRRRIEKRNSPAFARRFFDTWIPLEQAYFDAFDPAARCDLIMEANL